MVNGHLGDVLKTQELTIKMGCCGKLLLVKTVVNIPHSLFLQMGPGVELGFKHEIYNCFPNMCTTTYSLGFSVLLKYSIFHRVA